MNPVALRLLAHRLAAPDFAAPEEVVRHFGCVQAQEAESAAWAVAMRTKRPSRAAFGAAFSEGRILCAHLLRCTWQLVAAEDCRAVLAVCAAANRRLVAGYCAASGPRLSEAQLRRGAEHLAEIVRERGGSVRRAELLREAAASGPRHDAHALSCFLTVAEADGLLCSGAWNARERTYALLDARVPPAPAPSREEALVRLALAFFRSHGPATLADFVWWSGAGLRDCRAAVADLGDRLERVHSHGADWLLAADARTRGARTGAVHLLPAYDEWLIGYKDRSLVLPPEHARRAHDNRGVFRPIILRGGQVVGNWSPSARDPAATLDFFRAAPPPGDPATARAAARRRAFVR